MNRRTWMLFILSVLLFLVAATPVVMYASRYILPPVFAERSASVFFDSLVAEDYDRAFEYVAYDDSCNDMPAATSYESAKQLWIKRLKDLKAGGTYIKSYKNLKISSDDGVVSGTVDITLMENGRKKQYTQSLLFGGYRFIYKLQSCTLSNNDWAFAISGNLDTRKTQ